MIKKGIALIVVLLFTGMIVNPVVGNILSNYDVIPSVTTCSLDTPVPEIELEVKYGIGIKIIIENIGDVPANNMTWGFTVRGGHFNRINKSFSGKTVSFESGERICEKLFIFGFGFIYAYGSVKWRISLGIYFSIILLPGETFLFGPYIYTPPGRS